MGENVKSKITAPQIIRKLFTRLSNWKWLILDPPRSRFESIRNGPSHFDGPPEQFCYKKRIGELETKL
jgi:hypothetical protein